MGIIETMSHIVLRMNTMNSKIIDFFTLVKKCPRKSSTKKGTAAISSFPEVKLENIEGLTLDQLDEYCNEARTILIETAKRRMLITYDTLMYKLGLGPGRRSSGTIVRRVSEIELAEGRPKLSAVVVRGDTRIVGGGFFGLPSTPDSVKRSNPAEWQNPHISPAEQEYWRNELKKVYDYWCPEFR